MYEFALEITSTSPLEFFPGRNFKNIRHILQLLTSKESNILKNGVREGVHAVLHRG